MPSLPSMQSVHQASTLPPKQEETHEYRQTTYHDGSNVQIAESRRYPGAVRKFEQPVHTYADFVLYPKENESPHPKSGSKEVSSQSHPAPRRRAAEPNSGVHVTSAKHLTKVRSKPVILHTESKSSRKLISETNTTLHSSAGPKTPPTPRLGRLSTPELSDLDEAPFCDCGVVLHVVKRCTKCSIDIDLWLT